ncbi:MAG: hypothetical protein WD467_02005 [Candidatus Saccharimonadales bacterium]
MRKILSSMLIVVAGVLAFGTVGTVNVVYAQTAQESACIGAGGSWTGSECSMGGDSPELIDTVKTVIDVLLLVLGAVAVIMLVIGAFRFVVSGGDSNAVQGARNTILYAIVGIIVAFLSWAAVDFVIDQLANSGTTTQSQSENSGAGGTSRPR